MARNNAWEKFILIYIQQPSTSLSVHGSIKTQITIKFLLSPKSSQKTMKIIPDVLHLIQNVPIPLTLKNDTYMLISKNNE